MIAGFRLARIPALFLLTFALLCSAVGVAAAAPRASASPLASDKGKFRIVVNGQDAGQEEFAISPSGGNWVVHDNATIRAAQGVTHITGTLELHSDGTPSKYEWSTDGEKKASSTVTFRGATASIELRLSNASPYTQQFTFGSPAIVVLDNNLYEQYAVLARLYDWTKKGVQSFAVFVPQAMTPGTVTVESLGKQDSGGKQMDELRVKTEDIELDLYLDGPRLMRLEAPGAGAEIIRD